MAPSTYHADDGAAYERFLGRWTQRLAEPFIAFAQPPADGDVLDVGCGTGSLAMALATTGSRCSAARAGRYPCRRSAGAAIEAAVRAAYLSGAPDGPRSMTATAWAMRGIVA